MKTILIILFCFSGTVYAQDAWQLIQQQRHLQQMENMQREQLEIQRQQHRYQQQQLENQERMIEQQQQMIDQQYQQGSSGLRLVPVRPSRYRPLKY